MAGINSQDNDENAGPEHVQAFYKGYSKYEQNDEEFARRLLNLCPQAI